MLSRRGMKVLLEKDKCSVPGLSRTSDAKELPATQLKLHSSSKSGRDKRSVFCFYAVSAFWNRACIPDDFKRVEILV